MVRPRMLLFDEPFAGVDPMAVTSPRCRDARLDSGLSILITDHAVAATVSICDQVAVLKRRRASWRALLLLLRRTRVRATYLSRKTPNGSAPK